LLAPYRRALSSSWSLGRHLSSEIDGGGGGLSASSILSLLVGATIALFQVTETFGTVFIVRRQTSDDDCFERSCGPRALVLLVSKDILSLLFLIGRIIARILLRFCAYRFRWSLARQTLGLHVYPQSRVLHQATNRDFVVTASFYLVLSLVLFYSVSTESSEGLRHVVSHLLPLLDPLLLNRVDMSQLRYLVFYVAVTLHLAQLFEDIAMATYVIAFALSVSARGHYRLWHLRRHEKQMLATLDCATLLSYQSCNACTICREVGDLRSCAWMTLSCNHSFHVSCLTQWFRSSSGLASMASMTSTMTLSCPLCRRRFYLQSSLS
jgi:hypothetical protein